MATVYKVLGQAAPATTSNTDLYTVGAGKSAVISTLHIANTTASSATCRVFIRVAGAAAATTNAIVYDGVVLPNDFKALTEGFTLAATDVVTVQSGTASTLTFQLFGSEIA